MVRPHVEFASSVWCSFKLGNTEEIEKIQKRVNKLIIKLKHKPYKERLIHLNLPTLKYRRLHGDMIEKFWGENVCSTPTFITPTSITSG